MLPQTPVLHCPDTVTCSMKAILLVLPALKGGHEGQMRSCMESAQKKYTSPCKYNLLLSVLVSGTVGGEGLAQPAAGADCMCTSWSLLLETGNDKSFS